MKPAPIICVASWLSFIALVWVVILDPTAVHSAWIGTSVFGVIGAISGVMSVPTK